MSNQVPDQVSSSLNPKYASKVVLLYCIATFLMTARTNGDVVDPREFCLKKGELVDKKWARELLTYKDSRGYHDEYLFKR